MNKELIFSILKQSDAFFYTFFGNYIYSNIEKNDEVSFTIQENINFLSYYDNYEIIKIVKKYNFDDDHEEKILLFKKNVGDILIYNLSNENIKKINIIFIDVIYNNSININFLYELYKKEKIDDLNNRINKNYKLVTIKINSNINNDKKENILELLIPRKFNLKKNDLFYLKNSSMYNFNMAFKLYTESIKSFIKSDNDSFNIIKKAIDLLNIPIPHTKQNVISLQVNFIRFYIKENLNENDLILSGKNKYNTDIDNESKYLENLRRFESRNNIIEKLIKNKNKENIIIEVPEEPEIIIEFLKEKQKNYKAKQNVKIN